MGLGVLIREVTSEMLASEVLTGNESGCDSGYIKSIILVNYVAKNE